MELKYSNRFKKMLPLLVLIVPLWNWNYHSYQKNRSRYRVLIVPLWNWNLVEEAVIIKVLRSNRTFMELKSSSNIPSFFRTISSNRTFMELKYERYTTALQELNSSNRTFMELKYAMKSYRKEGGNVLIVPLWNWNWEQEGIKALLLLVLIVPLWNWNGCHQGKRQ